MIAPTRLNKFVHSMLPGNDSDQYFTVSAACTRCGTCEKVCPVQNIALESAKPAFQHKCEHCIACVHLCPAGAIDWKGAKTQGKLRYRNTHTSLNDLINFNR